MTKLQPKDLLNTFVIVRFYKESRKPSDVIMKGFTYDEAIKHCNSPTTRSETHFDGFHDTFACKDSKCNWCRIANKEW